MTRIDRPKGFESSGGRKRVLVENRDFGTGYAVERVLEAEGFDVEICGGPEALPGHRCPLVEQGRCEFADRADVIVHSLNPDRPDHAAVLHALRAHHPDTPLVVEIPRPALQRHAELLDGCTILALPATRDTLLAAVRSNLSAPADRRRMSSDEALVGLGDLVACEVCAEVHEVFDIRGEPRMQAVRCGTRTLLIAMENQRFG